VNASVFEIAQSRYDVGDILSAHPLEGGEWKTLYRLDATHGQFVLSISHPAATTESIAWEHKFLRYLESRLPEVPAPIQARDGQTWFVHEGRIASLLPFMPGQIKDASDIRPEAAQLLARYHAAAATYPNRASRPGMPALNEWDWDDNHAWRWADVEALLNSTPQTASRFWRDGGSYTQEIVSRRGQVAQELAACRHWVSQLTQSKRPLSFAPIHGDYYERNLLLQGDMITALLDWDGCHPDWLMLDVSNAVWEFCRGDDEHALDLSLARDFLHIYFEAGGPLDRHELTHLVPFMRFRMLLEALSCLQNILNGEQWDEGFAEYLLHNLLSLESLRKISDERFSP
jgi:Ser/Thr protein kinase RdoA (MazF antagonist)